MSDVEASGRLSDARARVSALDLSSFAGLAQPFVDAGERLGGADDVRGAVIAQAYAAMSGPESGTVPIPLARAIEAGARVVASGVAGLYVPPWVGGGGRIVWNVPMVAALMGREEAADRDALATLVVAHERVHHLQHGARAWQVEFLEAIAVIAANHERPDRSTIARTNAVMSVVEGHASLVERAVVEHLYGGGIWWRVRGRHLDRRLPGLLGALLSGLYATKRDQYKRGMLFCADSLDLVDQPFVTMFEHPGGMPLPHELDAPSEWARRTASL